MDLNFALARLVVSAVALLATSAPFAADWALIRGSEQGAPGYLQIDRATITRERSTVSFWRRAVYANPFEIPGTKGLKARVVVSHSVLDCANRTETTRKVFYLSDDKSQVRLAERGPYGPDDVIPGTPPEEVFEFVCHGKPIAAPPSKESASASKSAT